MYVNLKIVFDNQTKSNPYIFWRRIITGFIVAQRKIEIVNLPRRLCTKEVYGDLIGLHVMDTVFLFGDVLGTINPITLKKEWLLDGIFNLLDRYNHTVKKRPYLAKNNLSRVNYANVHTCVITMTKFHALGHELLPHPLYSPDLALRVFFLFPNMMNGSAENAIVFFRVNIVLKKRIIFICTNVFLFEAR